MMAYKNPATGETNGRGRRSTQGSRHAALHEDSAADGGEDGDDNLDDLFDGFFFHSKGVLVGTMFEVRGGEVRGARIVQVQKVISYLLPPYPRTSS